MSFNLEMQTKLLKDLPFTSGSEMEIQKIKGETSVAVN